MHDRELLQLAAKAYGLDLTQRYVSFSPCGREIWFGSESSSGWKWSPFFDYSDTMKLAVKLKIDIEFLHENPHEGEVVTATKNSNIHSICCFENTAMNSSLLAATCRAVVRAAAEIGKSMQ